MSQAAAICAANLPCQLHGMNPDVGGTCVKIAQAGQPCGGFTTCAAQCGAPLDAPLECQHDSLPDLPGKCVKGAQCGESCNTRAKTGAACATGLVCNQQTPSIDGTCVKVAGWNESCGGFRMCTPICRAPFECKWNGSIPDLPGNCVDS
ncbi:hypothetical protein LEN26_011826 [Aphanomyces euteiches]|nr:hypothetical protein LEN26_011826 [Aphanomyces euteiches]KAH9128379.1 hypothetical protein AeMF1_001479 [Aphanomyces euteiches]KAH9181927.1 hypothetical protein AeNC1_016095 [Aphanomyces euteiches]